MFFHHDEPHLIRARLHSRFQSSVHHHLWIKYTAHVSDPSAITHYYCQCKGGERTAGCCSHLASVSSPHSYQFFTNYKDSFYDQVIRFLCYDRHLPPNEFLTRHQSSTYIDAAAELEEIDSDGSSIRYMLNPNNRGTSDSDNGSPRYMLNPDYSGSSDSESSSSTRQRLNPDYS